MHFITYKPVTTEKKKPQQAGRRLYATYRQVTATASLPAHFIRQATPQLKIIICNLLVFQGGKKKMLRTGRAERITAGSQVGG